MIMCFSGTFSSFKVSLAKRYKIKATAYFATHGHPMCWHLHIHCLHWLPETQVWHDRLATTGAPHSVLHPTHRHNHIFRLIANIPRCRSNPRDSYKANEWPLIPRQRLEEATRVVWHDSSTPMDLAIAFAFGVGVVVVSTSTWIDTVDLALRRSARPKRPLSMPPRSPESQDIW